MGSAGMLLPVVLRRSSGGTRSQGLSQESVLGVRVVVRGNITAGGVGLHRATWRHGQMGAGRCFKTTPNRKFRKWPVTPRRMRRRQNNRKSLKKPKKPKTTLIRQNRNAVDMAVTTMTATAHVRYRPTAGGARRGSTAAAAATPRGPGRAGVFEARGAKKAKARGGDCPKSAFTLKAFNP